MSWEQPKQCHQFKYEVNALILVVVSVFEKGRFADGLAVGFGLDRPALYGKGKPFNAWIITCRNLNCADPSTGAEWDRRMLLATGDLPDAGWELANLAQ